MSDYDHNRHPSAASGGPVWSLAALSIALLLCSVLAAKLVGDMVDSELSQVAAAFASAGPARRGVARTVDPVVTGSIHRKDPSGAQAMARGQAGR